MASFERAMLKWPPIFPFQAVLLTLHAPEREDATETHQRRRGITWAAGTVDNEHMNRKKSKCCCVYVKPSPYGEESSSSSSSDSDSDEKCTDHCRGHTNMCYRRRPPAPAQQENDEGKPGEVEADALPKFLAIWPKASFLSDSSWSSPKLSVSKASGQLLFIIFSNLFPSFDCRKRHVIVTWLC